MAEIQRNSAMGVNRNERRTDTEDRNGHTGERTPIDHGTRRLRIGAMSQSQRVTTPQIEAMKTLMKPLVDEIKEVLGFETSFQVMQTNDIHYSIALLICRGNLMGTEPTAYVMPYILEASAPLPQTERFRDVTGEQLYQRVTPQTSWDTVCERAVEEYVLSRFPACCSVRIATAVVLQRTITEKDTSDIETLLFCGQEAIKQMIAESAPSQVELFHIKDDMTPDQTLVSEFAFNSSNGVEVDALGNTLRGDFNVSINVGPKHQQTRRRDEDVFAFNNSDSFPVAKASGYVNLIYSREVEVPRDRAPRDWIAQVVLNNVVATGGRMSLPLFLLTIANSFWLERNMVWANAVGRPRKCGDIGAIGYRSEISRDERFEIDVDDKDVVYAVVGDHFEPVPSHVVRCERAGINSWLTDTLLYACEENRDDSERYKNAVESIATALTELTGTRVEFTDDFVFANVVDYGHIGTYVDGNDVRSTEEVDLLYAIDKLADDSSDTLNVFEQTMGLVEDGIYAQSRRAQIVERLVGRAVDWRGDYVDVELSNDFKSLLVTLCSGAGLTVEPRGLDNRRGNDVAFRRANTRRNLGSSDVGRLVSRGRDDDRVRRHRR